MEIIEKSISEMIKKPIERLFNYVEEEIKQTVKNRILEYKVTEYKNCRFVKTLLYRNEPVDLYTFYQPQSIHKLHSSLNIEIIDLKFFFNNLNAQSKCITIIGNAGSGKSTLSKFLLLKSYEQSFKIPIRIELRDLNDYSKTILDFIIEKKFLFNELAFTEDKVNSVLHSGDILFIFDGFDEIKDKYKNKILKEIETLTIKYCENYYIITTRPNSLAETLNKFYNYQISDLSKKDILNLIDGYFKNEDTTSKNSLISIIDKNKNNYVSELIVNPLLLSMFILTYRTSSLPNIKSEFYFNIFEALYQLHGTISKQGYNIEIRSKLNKNGFLSVLKYTSIKSFFQQKYNFPERYVFDLLEEFKEFSNLIFENEKIITDLTNSIGIWLKDGLEITYIHRSIQEYFAALSIKDYPFNQKSNVYKSLFERAKKDLSYVTNKENFFTLLKEIDEVYVLQNLFLPLFKDLLIAVKQEKQDRLLYKYYGDLALLKEFFYPIGFSKKFEKLFYNENKLTSEQLLLLRHSIDIPRWEKRIVTDIMKTVKQFILQGDAVVTEIETKLRKQQSSPKKIIDIINVS